MKKRLCLMGAALLLFAVFLWQQSALKVEPLETGLELLVNGGFEAFEAEGQPSGWFTESYLGYADATQYAETAGMDGKGVSITNLSPNDARFAQVVKVRPGTVYRLSGQIRAQADGGRGANLSIAGVYVFSEPVFETQGEWQTVELYGKTGAKQREVTVFARLGGYSGEAVGEAAFDNLSLVAVEQAPEGALVYSWEIPATQAPAPATDEKAVAPFAPWFLLLAALGAGLMLALAKAEKQLSDRSLPVEKAQGEWLFLLALLAFAALSRLLVAARAPGFPVDLGAFRAWANDMAQVGPGGFYLQAGHRDYPPGYMLVLWPLGLLGQLLGTGATGLMVKTPAILFDLLIIALLYQVAKQYANNRRALLMASLYALNPLTYLAGAAWGQVDALPSLLLVLSVVLILRRCWRYSLPIYVLAVLMKPQALMVGPMGLLALGTHFLWQNDIQKRRDSARDVLLGVLLSFVVIAVIALPFFNEQNGFSWLIGLYANTMGFYRYATVNATNLYYLFGLNWVDIATTSSFLLRLLGGLSLLLPALVNFIQNRQGKDDRRARAMDLAALVPAALPVLLSPVPMSLSTYGTLMLVAVGLLVGVQYFRARDAASLPFFAGIMLLGFSILGTMMHERYLFLAMALLTLSYILRRDRRILYLLLAASALCFLNTGLVLDLCLRNGDHTVYLDAPAFGIKSATAWLEYALAFLSLPLASLGIRLGFTVWGQNAVLKSVTPLYDAALLPVETRFAFLKPKKQVRFDRKDALLIVLITLLYAVVALVNLGSTSSPQNAWSSSPAQTEAVLDLGEERDFRLLLFGGIHWADSDFQVEVSADGVQYDAYPFRIREGGLFAWKYLGFPYTNSRGETEYDSTPRQLTGRYVRISGMTSKLTLMEVIAQDSASGESIPFASASPGAEALIDEQEAFNGQPTWFNSMYFDEIYHARTALEQRNALWGEEPSRIYETSHPPLGKLLMTFSIMVFGMTPFGWRFAGAMAGVLMLPGMYLLGKQLTRRRSLGVLSMLLMAFDFMHFAQTRIATIDSFVTLFIIYAYYFMFRYMMMDPVRTGFRKKMVPLFLSGLMMGLSIASKWPGIYAGAGLAVLFFASIVRNLRQARLVNGTPDEDLPISPEELPLVRTYGERWLLEPLMTGLWCLLFFIAVPLVVYYLSYIPVYIATPGGLTIKKVIDNNLGMFRYHSEAGRGADHPYSSPWYSWPIIGKPMYFYSGGVRNGTSSVIWSFGNPLVWWGGLAALVLTAFAALRGFWQRYQPNPVTVNPLVPVRSEADRRPLWLLISFAAQYLPWVLVPRGTYIYHYFPSVPFIILCLALMADYAYGFRPKLGKWLVVALSLIAGAMFIAFFPYISGVRVSTAWLDAMRWLPNWLYY